MAVLSSVFVDCREEGTGNIFSSFSWVGNFFLYFVWTAAQLQVKNVIVYGTASWSQLKSNGPELALKYLILP